MGQEPKTFRIKKESGMVWVDPVRGTADPAREYVREGEPGFESQKHKLEPVEQTKDDKRPVRSPANRKADAPQAR